MSGPRIMGRALRAWPRLLWSLRYPERAQRRLWRHTASLLQAGSFWPARLGRLGALEDIEPTTYEDYRAAIDRSFQGHTSELNGEIVRHWVISSGSAGTRKMFPWTDSFIAQYRAGAQLPLPTLLRMGRVRGTQGGHLALVAHNPIEWSPVGIPVGYASNLDNAQINARQEGVYPRCVDDSTDHSRRWLPLYAVAADLASISAVTADHVLLLIDRVIASFEQNLPLLRGAEQPPAPFRSPSVSPERLAHLERVFARDAAPSPTDIWPRLRMIQTWRASTAGLQARHLQERVGPAVKLVDMAYCTTEGPVTLVADLDQVGGPIHPGAVIHELLELDGSAIRKPWELEPGRSYELLLTTAMGLVRYRIGDVVRCTGFHHRAPTLTFERRTTGELSLGVTTFDDEHLVTAMSALERPLEQRWVFGPSERGDGLVLYVDEPVPDAVIEALHDALYRHHGTYADRLRKGRVCKLVQQLLPAAHPMWAARVPRHGQGKAKVLLLSPPSDFEAAARAG